jgi:hypothetical protein
VKIRAVFTGVRDALLLGVGIFVIMYQQLTGRTNLELLIVALVIMQIPGAIGLLYLLRGKHETTGTAVSPSEQPSERS